MKDKQERVLSALMTARTREEAAAEAGVSRSTVDRYMKDTAFSAEYARRRDAVLLSVCDLVRGTMSEAVQIVAGIMRDETAQQSARLSAARLVMEYGVKLSEIADLTRRVQALEEGMDRGGLPQ